MEMIAPLTLPLSACPFTSAIKRSRSGTLPTGRLLNTLEGHAGGVYAVAMRDDGTRAVSGSDDNTLKAWDLITDKVVATTAADYPIVCCASSPRAETLVAGDTSCRLHFLWLEGIGLGT
jgi:WD40 repeat protein